MKPTAAANIDKDASRWSLSWQPDGRCNSFTKEAILACAPPTSGVYGLFNFDCQIFIGASANIREALLRHASETDFQSQHLRPTGFTFEPCAVELCKIEVDELTARFHPVLQSETALTPTRSPSSSPRVSEVSAGSKALETHANHQEFPAHERARHRKVHRRFHFERTRGAALAAIFVASAVVILFLSMPADYAIRERANGANTTPGETEIGLRPQNVASIDTPGGLVTQSAEPTPAKPDIQASASTPNGTSRFVAKSTSAADRAGAQAKTSPIAHSAESANLTKP